MNIHSEKILQLTQLLELFNVTYPFDFPYDTGCATPAQIKASKCLRPCVQNLSGWIDRLPQRYQMVCKSE